MGVSKNSGKTTKMDGKNNGKPYQNEWFGGIYTPIFGNTHIPKVYVFFFRVPNACLGVGAGKLAGLHTALLWIMAIQPTPPRNKALIRAY